MCHHAWATAKCPRTILTLLDTPPAIVTFLVLLGKLPDALLHEPATSEDLQ